MLGRAQQIGFLFFFFVTFVVAMKRNTADGLFTKSSILFNKAANNNTKFP
jgi:hypothetical protein